MNFFGKVVISVLAATAAWALLTFVPVAQPALVFLVLVIATLATAFLVTIPVSKAAVTASKPSNGSSKKQTTKASVASVTEGPREEGEVKWFNVSKGFGFITKDDGEEIFVHFRSIIGEGRRGLKDGQRVSFVEANTDKGPQAEDVEPL